MSKYFYNLSERFKDGCKGCIFNSGYIPSLIGSVWVPKTVIWCRHPDRSLRSPLNYPLADINMPCVIHDKQLTSDMTLIFTINLTMLGRVPNYTRQQHYDFLRHENLRRTVEGLRTL